MQLGLQESTVNKSHGMHVLAVGWSFEVSCLAMEVLSLSKSTAWPAGGSPGMPIRAAEPAVQIHEYN